MLQFSLVKKLFVLLVLLGGLYYAVPNALTPEQRAALPSWMSSETVNLGLDLQGGSHMVLEVDIDAVYARAYENLEDEVRLVLRKSDEAARVRYSGLRSTAGAVQLTLADVSELADVKTRLRERSANLLITAEDAQVTVVYTEEHLNQLRIDAVSQTLEILRSRVDEFGVAEPSIQRQGESRVIVELPGIDDVERAKSIIGRTAQLAFHMVDDTRDVNRYVGRRAPAGYMVAYETVENAAGGVMRVPYLMKKRPALTGENLAGASSGFDQSGQSSVNISFDAKGTRVFGQVTTQNTGKRMAILLDGVVYSAPVLREPILGGSASITGNFSPTEAQDLAMILRAGALPAPVTFAEERSIGPSLGQDSIDAGKNAIVVGFVAVLVVMLLFYRGFGLAANVALLFNLVLVVAFMTMIGATMTLPGIAGIVLTIGMAVDANVLIFERIREEFKVSGRVRQAMENGFKSAYGTILDANITTMIAAVVLFAVGSGPIKGFALTLSVGVASSMFTAIMVTRLLLSLWVSSAKPKTLKV